MATLCNACGINYRRARLKAKGRLDLDRLARAMGSKRPSIQKSLKRQRKLELSLQIRGTLRTQSQALHSPPHSYRDRGVTFESPSLPPIHTLFQTHAHSILPSVHSLLWATSSLPTIKKLLFTWFHPRVSRSHRHSWFLWQWIECCSSKLAMLLVSLPWKACVLLPMMPNH